MDLFFVVVRNRYSCGLSNTDNLLTQWLEKVILLPRLRQSN